MATLADCEASYLARWDAGDDCPVICPSCGEKMAENSIRGSEQWYSCEPCEEYLTADDADGLTDKIF